MIYNIYDIGSYTGLEIDEIVLIMKRHNLDYRIYSIEGYPEYANKLRKKYQDNPNIEVINALICGDTKETKLYISRVAQGHSIYDSKNNCTSNYVNIMGYKFSDFIKESFKDPNSINILRFNIEGAELDLLNDILENDLNKYINLWAGATPGADILKCAKIKDEYNDYLQRLKNNNIIIHHFCADTPNDNVDIEKLILSL